MDCTGDAVMSTARGWKGGCGYCPLDHVVETETTEARPEVQWGGHWADFVTFQNNAFHFSEGFAFSYLKLRMGEKRV